MSKPMAQLSLFGETPKPDKEPDKDEEDFPVYQPIKDTTHPELVTEFVNQCTNKQEQFDYTHVDINPHDKKGKEPYLVTRTYVGSTKGKPSGMTYRADSYELFLTSELEEKQRILSHPFAKNVPYLRQIPIQNYQFFITARAKKSLENIFTMMNLEFDIEKFIKEYNGCN